MRVPGATRGCIYLDEDSVIIKIDFYQDTCYGKVGCFDKKMENIKEKYIGRKVVITKE